MNLPEKKKTDDRQDQGAPVWAACRAAIFGYSVQNRTDAERRRIRWPV